MTSLNSSFLRYSMVRKMTDQESRALNFQSSPIDFFKKSKMAVWFVSNCVSRSGRGLIAKKLNEYLPVSSVNFHPIYRDYQLAMLFITQQYTIKTAPYSTCTNLSQSDRPIIDDNFILVIDRIKIGLFKKKVNSLDVL